MYRGENPRSLSRGKSWQQAKLAPALAHLVLQPGRYAITLVGRGASPSWIMPHSLGHARWMDDAFEGSCHVLIGRGASLSWIMPHSLEHARWMDHAFDGSWLRCVMPSFSRQEYFPQMDHAPFF
eukprot:scaffold15824_cov19-Tisochrysis_lutea.AAC.3